MTLTEIEELARFVESRQYERGPEALDLARFVLRALPLIRAAEEWRDTVQSGHIGKHDENMNNLIARVDAFRGGDK